MIYRFKSRAAQDFVMLETNAKQLFSIIGKSPAPTGIITVAEIPAAVSALEAAVAQEASNPHHDDQYAVEGHEASAEVQHISLRQRAAPMLRILKDSLADSKDVTWGT